MSRELLRRIGSALTVRIISMERSHARNAENTGCIKALLYMSYAIDSALSIEVDGTPSVDTPELDEATEKKIKELVAAEVNRLLASPTKKSSSKKRK